jgi:putative hemolysin
LDISFWIELALFVLLLGLSGFFSSSETALFSLSSIQLEQMRKNNDARVGLIERMLSEPRRLIVTILIGNEFVNVAASVLSAAMVIELLGAEQKFFNLFVMVPILLLFGEITPKTLAIRNNVAFARVQSGPINAFARLITPLRWLVRKVAELFITLIVGKERSRGNIITEDMVRTLAHEAVGEGALDQTEALFIDQIFDFGNMTLEDVMTPRADVHFLSLHTDWPQVLEAVRESRQSRFPVYDAHRDNIVGILHARDLLKVDFSANIPVQRGLQGVLRDAYFVPDSKPAADQFDDFRQHRRSFALTVDEYGGVTGLVTMEDLLECIFGDIPSRSDIDNKALITPLEDSKWAVDGSLPIAEFNRELDEDLSDEVVETIGGLVLHAHGEVPDEGCAVEIEQLRFTVMAVEQNRISDLIVERLIEPVPSPDVESPDETQQACSEQQQGEG